MAEPGRIAVDAADAAEFDEIVIEPSAIGNLFKAGHRIRLGISSSNLPRYDINYNTGEPEGLPRRRRIAFNTAYVDRARASHVILPVVPVEKFDRLSAWKPSKE